MNYNNLYSVLENFNTQTDNYLGVIFANVFKEFPHAYRVYYNENNELIYQDAIDSFYEARKKIKTKIDCRKLLKNLVNTYDELQKNESYDHFLYNSIIFAYSQHEHFVFGEYKKDHKQYSFLLNITLSEDGDMANYYEEIYCTPDTIEDIFENLKPYFAGSTKEDKVDFGIAAIDASNSIYTTWYDYNPVNVDINKNYNDDFKKPYNKLCDLIQEEDKASLIFLYGEPGTGKTTVIKHLISKYPEKEFVFIDGNLLYNASPEKLMAYFLDCQNTIFILEDCEKALMSRDKGYNPVMTTLLNLTDGIISDVLGIKLICTFNTNLNNIDKALLRKGRLSLKYEFKKLSKEKASELIGETVKEDMSLADIYNYKEENDFSKKNEKKIGFNV